MPECRIPNAVKTQLQPLQYNIRTTFVLFTTLIVVITLEQASKIDQVFFQFIS